MATEQELQHLAELADARLGVAEDFGWIVAALALLLVQLKWDTWIGGIAAAVVSYVFATHTYRRGAAKAEDEYFKAARLGKYSTAGGADP